MSNPRDTGRYDATTQTWHSENIRVDFAWGNIPMQPNDDREVPLDPDLDNHIIAVTGYQNFPSFTRGGVFDDTEPNVVVPDLVGLPNPETAQEALEDVGLVLGATDSSTVGATAQNDERVKSQTPAAGTSVNEGDAVDIVIYNYVPATVPNLVGVTSQSAAVTLLTQAGLVAGTVSSSEVGATDVNNGHVKSQSPAAGTEVAPGSSVNFTLFSYVAPPATTGPISGFNRASGVFNSGLNGDDAIMYLVGQTVKPTAGWTISVTGASNSNYNRDWTVVEVKNDNSYNTNGTAVKITKASGDDFLGGNSTGGTWTKAGFNSADSTLTGVSLSGSGSSTGGWAFSKSGHTVAVGDWVRASGFFVIDQNGNRTPTGQYDVNGDWQIDDVTANTFSSAALRTELTGLLGFNASSFGSGTVAVDNQ